jgi:hypothetical protein
MAKGFEILLNENSRHRFMSELLMKIDEMELGSKKKAHAVANEILRRSQLKVPVKTGYLKSTGKVVPQEHGFSVLYDADYAIYVHEIDYYKHKNGQSKFLSSAYDEVMSELKG